MPSRHSGSYRTHRLDASGSRKGGKGLVRSAWVAAWSPGLRISAGWRRASRPPAGHLLAALPILHGRHPAYGVAFGVSDVIGRARSLDISLRRAAAAALRRSLPSLGDMICSAYVHLRAIRSVAAGAVAEPARPVELPAVGEAQRGTPLARLDRGHAEHQAKLKAAGAARRKALVAAGTAMLRAINRGDLNPRSIKPGPPRWPESAPVPAEEPEDRGSLAWLLWHNAQNPQPPEEYAAEVAAYRRTQFAELTSGKVQPATTRRGPRTMCRPRERRERRTRRRSSSSGDEGRSTGDDPEPPGVAPGGDLKHDSGLAGSARARTRARARAPPLLAAASQRHSGGQLLGPLATASNYARR